MQKVNDPAVRHTSSGALIRRFLPYLAKYKKTLFIDLFCAAMTTLCDIILPKIMSTITNSAMHRWYLSVMEEIKLSTIFITHDIDEAVLLSDRILILSGRPGKITHQITIAEPKPRRRDFNLTPEFLDYKKQVINALGVVL